MTAYRFPIRQRGAALLTAMIIVTLVATLAAAMVWQQWRAIQVEAAERTRLQAAWMLSGALDWARLILLEDARNQARPQDDLGEPWAVPLAEARVSTFLAVDKDNTDDAPEAFLSGNIVDMQSHYNLRNLLDASNKPSAEEIVALQRLFKSTGISEDLAERITNGLKDALGGGSSSNAPLMPQTLAQLSWLGVDDDSVRRMAPYVTLLPQRTPVNLNTAPREVLAAVLGVDIGTAERLVQERQRTPFKTAQTAIMMLPDSVRPAATALEQRRGLDIKSSYFQVRGRLRINDRVLEESSLIERRGLTMVPLSRERENSRGFAG